MNDLNRLVEGEDANMNLNDSQRQQDGDWNQHGEIYCYKSMKAAGNQFRVVKTFCVGRSLRVTNPIEFRCG